MAKLRAVSEWMDEDVAWMELLDLERAGFHYNLEEQEGQMTAEEEQEMIEEYADYAEIV